MTASPIPHLIPNPLNQKNKHKTEQHTCKHLRFGESKEQTYGRDIKRATNQTSKALDNRNYYRDYHPATPAHRMKPRKTAEPERCEWWKPMDVSQRHQYLSRILTNRRFDGVTADGNKTVSLDDFVDHLEHCRDSTGLTDRDVLDLIAPIMTGEAYRWWQNNGKKLVTIDEFDSLARRRFGGKSTRFLSRIAEFTNRQQGDNEELLAYMDVMRHRAEPIKQSLNEDEIISTIIDNANVTCRGYLGTREYDTIDELNRYMEFLAQSKLPGTLSTEKKHTPNVQQPKRTFYTPSYKSGIHAIEAEQETEPEGTVVSTIPIDVIELIDRTATATIGAVKRDWRSNYRPNGTTPSNTVTEQNETKTNEAQNSFTQRTYTTPFECWGCKTPNVMRKDCPKCNQTVPSNELPTQVYEQLKLIADHLKNGYAAPSNIVTEQPQ